jgi:uncharacterized protein (DUF433 family)
MLALQPTSPPLTADANGVLRVNGTRVTLESVAIAFDRGATAEEIVHRYPSLDLTSVYEVIAYILRHREAVGQYLAERDANRQDVGIALVLMFPQDGIRARLLARQDPSDGAS